MAQRICVTGASGQAGRAVGEFGTLLSIDRARQVLGFEPRHSWRDHVSADAAP